MDLSQIIVPDNSLGSPIVTCTIEGILDEGDLRMIVGGGEAPTPPKPVDDPANLIKIREKHHSVARLVATGLQQRMVAQLVGYTESYLSILLNNPAMQELVEMYRIQAGAANAVITEKLATVGLKAMEALDEKLEGGELSNQELIATAKLGLDRGGFGPQSKHHAVHDHNLIDHARLEELNQNARARSREYIVPVKEIRQAISLPAPTPDEGTDDV